MNRRTRQNYLVGPVARNLPLAVISITMAFMALTASTLLGQVLFGSLNGNVTDPSGQVVVGASVELTNNATNLVRNAVTSSSGSFLFSDLQPGIYTLSVTAPTFTKTLSNGILIQENVGRSLNVSLEVATVGQTVTVTTAPPILQTEQANVATELDESQLQNLPSVPDVGMRNFQTLYWIVPGAAPPENEHSETSNPGDTMAVNMNGVSYLNNNTTIDGVSDLQAWLPEVPAYVPSSESIQSVNIATNSFDAEQGFAAGAVVNIVTKSGTNHFHGTAWEYNTISALQAKNYFVPAGTAIPKFVLNEFGANLGGPIVRNKAFFFGNWERFRRSEDTSGFQTIAPLAVRAGNFQGTNTVIYDPATGNADGTGRQPFPNNIIPANRLSNAATIMAGLLPAPNVNTASFSNNYFSNADGEYTRDNIDSRVDYDPSSKDTLFGRYSIQKAHLFDPEPLSEAGGTPLDGGQPGNSPSTIQAIGIGGTHTFSPVLLLDANFGYTRVAESGENTDLGTNFGLSTLGIPGTNSANTPPAPLNLYGGVPNFELTGLSSIGGSNVYSPTFSYVNIYTTAANLTWSLGKHSIGYGMSYLHYDVDDIGVGQNYSTRGGFIFTGGLTALAGGAVPNTYNSWADFLLGLPQTMGKEVGFFVPATLRESAWAGYAQDHWQIRPNVTLNYGLRYEVYPMGTSAHFGAVIYQPTDGNVSIGGLGGVPKTAGVDTGHGNFVPRIGLAYNVAAKTVVRGGYGVTVNPTNFKFMTLAYPSILNIDATGTNAFQAAGDLRTGLPAITFPDISQGTLKLPTSLATYTYPTKFRRGYIESYNAAIQQEVAGFSLQATYVGTMVIREMVALNLNAAPPGGGAAGRALFETLGQTGTITQDTPMGWANYNGLQVVAKRPLKDGGVIGVNYTYSKVINNYADNSDTALPVNYSPDYFLNRGPAGIDLTHNFEAYGVYSLPFGKGQLFYQDGPFEKVLSGWQVNFILSRTSGTPFTVTASGASLNAPGNSQFANQVVPKVRILGGHNSLHPYFDPTAFASVTTAAFGNAGRNSVRGPGFFSPSLGVAKTFAFSDMFKLQFRAEAFNFTNTPSFDNPASDVSSETATSLNGFGIISAAKAPRTLRLAGRFTF
jgi:hypothetical protein